MVLQRRIDALCCSSETAREKAAVISAGVQSRAKQATQDVADGFDEIIRALEERKMRLMQSINEMAEAKIASLAKQVDEIQAGVCPSNPLVSDDSNSREDGFLLCTDAVINFRSGDKELAERIKDFGTIDDVSTYASQSYLRGPLVNDTLKVMSPSWLYVYACDRAQKAIPNGGERVVAWVDKPDHFEAIEVKDMEDGRYKVSVVPKANAETHYTLRIAIGPEGEEEDVCGSPLDLTVLPARNFTEIGGSLGEAWCQSTMGQLRSPSGITFDSTGSFALVADQCSDRLQVFDVQSRTVISSFGKKGSMPQELNTPGSIVIDRENRVVISDILNHRLQVLAFNPSAASLWHMRTVGCQGSAAGQFQFPRGLVATEEGLLFVCDSQNNRVQVFDMNDDFRFVREFGKSGEGRVVMPVAVTVNRAGDILVADANNRIQYFDQKGTFLRAFGASHNDRNHVFSHISSILVTSDDLLFVCDDAKNRIQIFGATDEEFIHKFGGSRKKIEPVDGEENEADDGRASPGLSGRGSPVPGENGLRKPADIAVDSRGLILVTDYAGHVIWDC